MPETGGHLRIQIQYRRIFPLVWLVWLVDLDDGERSPRLPYIGTNPTRFALRAVTQAFRRMDAETSRERKP